MHDIFAATMFISLLFALLAGGVYAVEFWPAYATAGPIPEPFRPDGI